jgi:hypothetical protein
VAEITALGMVKLELSCWAHAALRVAASRYDCFRGGQRPWLQYTVEGPTLHGVLLHDSELRYSSERKQERLYITLMLPRVVG